MPWFRRKKKEPVEEPKTVEPNINQSNNNETVPTDTNSVFPEQNLTVEQPKEGVPPTAKVDEDDAEKYNRGLEKSRQSFGKRLTDLFVNFNGVDDDFYDDLEETLIEADVGFETALQISEEVREEVGSSRASDPKVISQLIVDKLVALYTRNGRAEDNHLVFAKEGPSVFLFVGVNGVGKTTSIGKLAARFKARGRRVLLAACDTFRAGAIEQLQEWGKRDGVDVVAGKAQSDPAAVAFEAVKKAREEGYDLVLIDTAGRLQNKVNLMKELDKIKRVIEREIPHAPQETLLVLDSTTGQNALTQAKAFLETTDVTGIILTKLDGTAKGGIVLPIRNQLHLSVKYVGLGETVEDLSPFNPEQYVNGLFKDLISNRIGG